MIENIVSYFYTHEKPIIYAVGVVLVFYMYVKNNKNTVKSVMQTILTGYVVVEFSKATGIILCKAIKFFDAMIIFVLLLSNGTWVLNSLYFSIKKLKPGFIILLLLLLLEIVRFAMTFRG